MCPKAALNYIKVLVSLCQWYSWGYKSGLPFLPMFLERTKPFSKWFRWLLSYFSKGRYRAAIILNTREKNETITTLFNTGEISTEQNLLVMLWFELLFEKYELHHSLFKAAYHSSILRQSLKRLWPHQSYPLQKLPLLPLYWPFLSALKLVQTHKSKASVTACTHIHPLSKSHAVPWHCLSFRLCFADSSGPAWSELTSSAGSPDSGLPHRPQPSAHCSTDTTLTQGAHHVFISPSISAALKSSLFSFSPQPSPLVVSTTALPGVPPLLLR